MITDDSQVFWSNLEKIQNQLLLGDSEFSLLFGMDAAELKKQRLNSNILTEDRFDELSEKMNFGFDDLFNKNFNIQYNPHKKAPLLNKYNVATYSHTRPILNVFNYVEMKNGERAKVELLREFQLSEDFINDAKK